MANTQTQDKKTVDNLGEAISVLVQAVNIAQNKGGVYTFGDAAKINSALEFVSALQAEAQKETEGPEGPKVKAVEVDKTAK